VLRSGSLTGQSRRASATKRRLAFLRKPILVAQSRQMLRLFNAPRYWLLALALSTSMLRSRIISTDAPESN